MESEEFQATPLNIYQGGEGAKATKYPTVSSEKQEVTECPTVSSDAQKGLKYKLALRQKKAGELEQVPCPAEGCCAKMVALSIPRHMSMFHPGYEKKRLRDRTYERYKCPIQKCGSITGRMKQHLELLKDAVKWTLEVAQSELYDECLIGSKYSNGSAASVYRSFL